MVLTLGTSYLVVDLEPVSAISGTLMQLTLPSIQYVLQVPVHINVWVFAGVLHLTAQAAMRQAIE